ncbi:MAG: serine/threonine-protein kinase [Prosthecobacter sp.]
MLHDLLDCIHRSSQGEVWRARDRETGAIVAVKKPGGPALLVAIRHPNVVRVIEADAEEMVMEWVEGASLETLGKLDAAVLDQLVRETLGGLGAIHEAGLLHLDLKPENILRSATGFLISDFGSAKRIGEARADLKGSVHYMAPECFEGAELNERTDLYSLGCVLYFALTGRTAIEGELAPQVITAHLQHRLHPLPGPLGAWIDRLMARNPADRPASAREALAEYPAPSEG